MNDSQLRAAFGPARTLEPTPAEIARALRPRRRRRWPVFVGVAAAIAVTGTAATAVEPIRGALATLLGTDEPGRPASADAPAWIGTTGTRVIAEADDVKLYVRREGDTLHFALDDSVGFSGDVKSWHEQFEARALHVLGPSGDLRPDDTRALFGVTARSVVRVRLTYAHGPSTVASTTGGGFVLLVDARRPLRDLVGFDAAGAIVERKDLRDLDLRVCHEVRGCPPGRLDPERTGG